MKAPSRIANAAEIASKGDFVCAVRDAIHDHIRSNALTVGAPLPSEAEFARTCGVSRVVVREAFRSLSAIGVIDTGNGRRARVGAIDSAMLATAIDHAVHAEQMSIQQIYDVRRTLEARTASLAALRATAAERETIVRHAAAMRADFADAPAVMEHDVAFHAAVAAASGNPAFALIVGAFETVMRATWPVGWRSRRDDAERMISVDGHVAIARAIADAEPERARTEMHRHFDHSVKALIEAGVL